MASVVLRQWCTCGLLLGSDQNAKIRLAQSPASWVCREKSFMLGILGKEPSEPVELLLPKMAFSILIYTIWRCSIEAAPCRNRLMRDATMDYTHEH